MAEIKYNRLQIVLVEFEIDQIELANQIGVNRNSVSRWCRNMVQPSLYQLRAIAEFFRIDIRQLIQPTDWSKLTGTSPVDQYKEKRKREKSSKIKRMKSSTTLSKKKK